MNKMHKAMMEFVPTAVWSSFANYWNIDSNRVPYWYINHISAGRKRQTYAIYDYRFVMVGEERTAQIVITYKSISSRDQFKRTIFLEGHKQPSLFEIRVRNLRSGE